MKADIEIIARDILNEVGNKISKRDIKKGSKVEVMAGIVEEDYFISVSTQEQEAEVNLCHRGNLGKDFDYVLKILERVQDGLVYEKYRAPIILTYLPTKDKPRLGIPITPKT